MKEAGIDISGNSTKGVFDFFKQIVCKVYQVGFLMDGIGPDLYVFPFILADLIDQDVGVIKRSGNNEDGKSKQN